MFPRQAIYRLLRDAGAYKFCTGGYRRALLAKYVFTWSLFSSQSKALTDIGRCDVLDSLKNSSQKIFKTALKSTFHRVRHSVKRSILLYVENYTPNRSKNQGFKRKNTVIFLPDRLFRFKGKLFYK